MLCLVSPPWPPSKDFGLSLVPDISSDCSNKLFGEVEEEQSKEIEQMCFLYALKNIYFFLFAYVHRRHVFGCGL